MEQQDYNQTPPKKSSSIKHIFRFLPPVIFFGLITFLIMEGITSKPTNISTKSQADQRMAVNAPLLTKSINKSFIFSLLDQTGQEMGKFTYTIDSVELRNQIVVKDQEATAIQGKRFLVINVNLTNADNKPISVNARDYLRVTLDNSPEKFAPDLHSDPVDVQAISTKSTRLGLTIDDTVKNITLQVGEITGKKASISIPLN